MFKKYNHIVIYPIFLTVLSASVLFGDSVVYADDTMIHTLEPYIELVNLLLITIVLAVSLNVSSRMGGVVREVINAIILVLVLFWIKEFIAVLTGFEVIALEGIVDVIEFFMILTLLVALNKLRKLF